eukprot:9115909-Lingulodinium_polyedra.AAC.1
MLTPGGDCYSVPLICRDDEDGPADLARLRRDSTLPPLEAGAYRFRAYPRDEELRELIGAAQSE